jgi:hypothetical protein
MRGILSILGLSIVSLHAATLEYLSLDDMAKKSTAIVRGRVQSCAGEFRGSVIFTHCKIAVSEQWKGTSQTLVDVATPGGTARGMAQNFSGSPKLVLGQEYVLFLWTGKSGMTQVIGLSQGVFDLKSDTKGQAVVQRAATAERMLDAAGDVVANSPLEMRVRDLRNRVNLALASEASGQ